MKKIKNLSILLIAVIMSSAGLVSCIDNEISPVVEEIYRNQALLIASQANLNDAKAAYQDALARLEDARAAAVASAADDASQAQDDRSQAQDDASAIAAQYLSEREAALEQQIALNAIALETALMALEQAQLEWEAAMVALQGAIDEANIALASEYFTKYQAAKSAAVILEGQAIMKQSQIDVAELLIKDMGHDPDVSWEYYLAQQEELLTSLQSQLAAKQVAAADLAAVIADPSTVESMSSALQAEQDENEDAIDAIYIEIAGIEGDLLPVFEELSNIGDLDSDYHDTKNDIENLEGDIAAEAGFIEWVETAVVPDLENQIASYDANIAAAQAGITAAEGVVTAAEGVVTAAEDAKALTAGALSDANDDVTDATNERDDRQAEWDAQETAVNNAAIALVAAEIAAASNDGAAAELGLLNADIATQGTAVVEYDLARSIFEADPAGTTWTAEYAGVDGVLGDHSDGNLDSYMEVLLVNITPQVVSSDVDFTGPLYSDGSVAPVVGNLVANAWPNLITGGGTDEGNYFDVEADDDMAPTNEDRFIAATTAKLAADDAVTAAQGVYDTALAAEGVVDQSLTDALAAYDAQVVIFEDNGAAIVLAQGVLDAAIAAQGTAATADGDAAGVLSDAYDDLDDAEDDLEDAEDDLDDLENYTPADMQEAIVDWEHQVVEHAIYLAIMEARLVDLIAEFAVIEAELDALGAGEAYQALIDLYNEMEILEAEVEALEMRNEQIEFVLDVMDLDNSDLQDILDDCNDDIAALEDSIAAQEAVIAVGEVDEAAAQAAIAQLENELTEIEAQIDAFNLLADKYWELMEAALAS